MEESYRFQAKGREGNGLARQWRALFHAKMQLDDALIESYEPLGTETADTIND